MKRILLSIFVCIVPYICFAQYNLYVFEPEYLEIPDPPMNGYIESAWWSCDSDYIYFDESSNVGAIIWPERYFEGEVAVTCEYYYSYYGYDNNMHAVNACETFYISCIAVNATLDKDIIELSPGENHKIIYHLESSSYKRPSPEWISNNPNVASINSDGIVTAHAIGSARITCDPIIGPRVYCDIVVTEHSNNEDDDSSNEAGDSDDNENNTDNPTQSPIEKSAELIEDLKQRTEVFLYN